MFDKFIKIIAPHLCYVCSKKGTLLCDSCIYNITQDSYARCISCQTHSLNGVCRQCLMKVGFNRAWIVGERENEIKKLLDDLKFQRCYEASVVCAQLLHEVIPILPEETVVTYIPTIPKHIRSRGYDHAALIAQNFASKRQLVCKSFIKRKTNSIQLGSNAMKRRRQGQKAFQIKKKLTSNVPYLLVDDIVTTGATLNSATSLLRSQGISEIWVAVVAQQPLRNN